MSANSVLNTPASRYSSAVSVQTALWKSKHSDDHQSLQREVSLFKQIVSEQPAIAYPALAQIVKIGKFKNAGGRAHVMQCFEQSLLHLEKTQPKCCTITAEDGNFSFNKALFRLIFPRSAIFDISYLAVSKSTLELVNYYIHNGTVDWGKGLEEYLEFMELCVLFDAPDIRSHIFEFLLKKLNASQEMLVALNSCLHTEKTTFDSNLLAEIEKLPPEDYTRAVLSIDWSQFLGQEESAKLLAPLKSEVPPQDLNDVMMYKDESTLRGAIIRALIASKELHLVILSPVCPETIILFDQASQIHDGLRDSQQVGEIITKIFSSPR